MRLSLLLLVLFLCSVPGTCWVPIATAVQMRRTPSSSSFTMETSLAADSSSSNINDSIATFPSSQSMSFSCKENAVTQPAPLWTTRRGVFQKTAVAASAVAVSLWPNGALAATPATNTASAEITDRIFITIKGLPSTTTSSSSSSSEPPTTKRIVIGLFGKDAPQSTQQVKQLVSKAGLAAPCRPKAERTLQKEQLEANKVYNSCIESETVGVTLQYSTIWRIIKNVRIDVGAVTGKFVARDYPTWQEDEQQQTQLRHDAPGVVSVRRGNEGGFGFTIYPGTGDTAAAEFLDQDHIVIGRVLEGMDVVQQLNEIPVIASSKVNYMALTGGETTKNAPSRACRYGGPMYCNENKPLVKLSIVETGIL